MEQQQNNISSLALQIAISQLGKRESAGNHNTGPEVDKYLASVGIKPGNSWCMAFVYWCYEQASKEMSVQNPLIKTGGVLQQWHLQLPRRKVLQQTASTNAGAIKPGSIFIMDFGGGKGHTGLVESFDGKIINTVEGNSNDDGSREGYEVCRKPGGRKLISVTGFIVI